MDIKSSENKTKFQRLVEEYEKRLNESGFAPIAPINSAGSTQSPSTSAVDQAVDTDPGVLAAKKKVTDAISLNLQQQASHPGSITKPN